MSEATRLQLAWANRGLLIADSALVTLFVLLNTIKHSVPTSTQPASQHKPVTRRRTSRVLATCIAATYLAQAIIILVPEGAFDDSQTEVTALSFLCLSWGTFAVQNGKSARQVKVLSALSACLDISLLAISTRLGLSTIWQKLACVLGALRFITSICLAVEASLSRNDDEQFDDSASAEETGSLLHGQRSGFAASSTPAYGSMPTDDNSDGWDSDGYDSDDSQGPVKITNRMREKGNWAAYLKEFKVFMPYLIPRNDRKVQFAMVVSLFCLIGHRALNILIPRQLGIITDQVLGGETLPYSALLTWLILSVLNEESGLGMIEGLAMIPIKQFSYRQLTVAAFEHVMGLSLDFHSGRDSAEVMKAIEQGEAMTRLLETVLHEIVPMGGDLCVAFFFLYSKFNAYVALAMLAFGTIFVTLEVITSNWNIPNRRLMTKSQREESRVMHQAVQGWQTTSIFNMFRFEKSRFTTAVDTQLAASRVWTRWDVFIKAGLELLIPLTFITVAGLVLHEVSQGRSSPGDFVFLLQYWDYLVWPIKFLSNQYRALMSDLVDAERLLDLFQTKTTVEESPNAKRLANVQGRVDFEGVHFTYDEKRDGLSNINITALPGQTIALVGTTGAGKSTVMKLLMRFYDVSSGSIKIDGVDIRDATLGSLRDSIGFVPQDPLLFNDTIIANIRYARPTATDEEIMQACRKAAIHDKIVSFPDGYETQAGEQGVKLSRGEVQRLAIARVFLKDPAILVLDEATSAVDSKTESDIQSALNEVTKRRTTFAIAHRLSTVTTADQIIVIENGSVIQRGTHQQLKEVEGKYQELCKHQF